MSNVEITEAPEGKPLPLGIGNYHILSVAYISISYFTLKTIV